jgi:hypothetical protein
MTMLSAVRNTLKFKDTSIWDLHFVPIADNVKIFVGGMVGLNSAGLAVRGGDTTCVGPIIGKAEVPYLPQPTTQNTSPNTVYDNTFSGHAASSLQVVVRTGVFKYGNGSAADAITQADVGQDCFCVDDQTVGRVPATGRVRAGKVMQVDSDGVWVAMGYYQQAGLAGQYLCLPVTLASLVVGGGTIAGPITLGFGGRIMSIQYVAAVTGTGAGATFACNLKIGATPTTGGVCTITLANTGYAATPVLGTAVTALNQFGPTDTITLVNAAGTVFTAGSGYFLIALA